MSIRPTKSQLIGELVMAAINATTLTWNAYVDAVVTHYHDTTQVTDRILKFHVASTADEVEDFARLNTQTVKRMLIGDHKLVADIEDALIAALPEDWRCRLLTALLDRHGLLLARKPPAHADAAGQITTACALMRKAAGAVQAIAPILENGTVDAADAPHLVPALDAVNKVMGACVTLSTQLTTAIGQYAPPARAH
ncbi:hypothetical protein [Luteimonas terrae]|uniref:Uncharacterized protein n=1 Tax=Luteimonas terrae TaxID=1530191 RepID=A0ABU1XZC4_9GAMM|nr:hypothetical protein [Luteimonas terrae]MDR7193376.1 hypothetical protein [Luteimonas terrae]